MSHDATRTAAPPDPAATTAGPAGPDDPTAAVPDRVGRFVPRGEIVRGGMGVVYRAYDPELDREVAVKVLADRLAGRADAARRRRVIHRDLKPTNVMVGAFGDVQVMNWGLAKRLADGPPGPAPTDPAAPADVTEVRTLRDSDGSVTQAGSVLGTPAYMPPEQAAGETDVVDRRADVFGLGAILCAVLTGSRPYVGADAAVVHLMAECRGGGRQAAAKASVAKLSVVHLTAERRGGGRGRPPPARRRAARPVGAGAGRAAHRRAFRPHDPGWQRAAVTRPYREVNGYVGVAHDVEIPGVRRRLAPGRVRYNTA